MFPVKKPFMCKILKLLSGNGCGTGAALSAAAIRNIPVFEYAPLRVKQAVVGFGRASKEQMSVTLAQMLGLPRRCLSTRQMLWG